MEEVEELFKESNYGEFKGRVADKVIEVLLPIQKKYNEVLNSNILEEILKKGNEKTMNIAKEKYEELKNIVGLHI